MLPRVFFLLGVRQLQTNEKGEVWNRVAAVIVDEAHVQLYFMEYAYVRTYIIKINDSPTHHDVTLDGKLKIAS